MWTVVISFPMALSDTMLTLHFPVTQAVVIRKIYKTKKFLTHYDTANSQSSGQQKWNSVTAS